MNQSAVSTIIQTIIEHQSQIIGPLAVEQANKVTGILVNDGTPVTVTIKATDIKNVLTDLVDKYKELFGQASVEVCRDAVREIRSTISETDIPDILK